MRKKVTEEKVSTPKVWNVTRLARVEYFLRTTPIDNEEERLKLICDSMTLALIMNIAWHASLVQEASALIFFAQYKRGWKKQVRVLFGNDVSHLIEETWKAEGYLEKEQYNRLEGCSWNSRIMVLGLALLELARVLEDPEMDDEDKQYACGVADWKETHLEVSNEISRALRRLIEKYEKNEGIEFIFE